MVVLSVLPVLPVLAGFRPRFAWYFVGHVPQKLYRTTRLQGFECSGLGRISLKFKFYGLRLMSFPFLGVVSYMCVRSVSCRTYSTKGRTSRVQVGLDC